MLQHKPLQDSCSKVGVAKGTSLVSDIKCTKIKLLEINFKWYFASVKQRKLIAANVQLVCMMRHKITKLNS